MKKHDEGYVLAYVTVVLLVFCLVATAILTGALKNLQAQQDAITRMQDKYAAQGMIEQVMAQLNGGTAPDAIVDSENLTVTEESGIVTVTATSGSIKIICELEKKDNAYIYKSYTTETVPPEEVVPG